MTRPALRNRATTCSRYASGSPSASAIAFRLVGCSAVWRPSSTISRTPYSAFEEKIMLADKSYQPARFNSENAPSAGEGSVEFGQMARSRGLIEERSFEAVARELD